MQKSKIAAILIAGNFLYLGGGSVAFGDDFWPQGYEQVSLESDWLGPNNDRESVCSGMAAKKYQDRKFRILSISEQQKFRIPELRIDAQYKYSCTVMLAPK